MQSVAIRAGPTWVLERLRVSASAASSDCGSGGATWTVHVAPHQRGDGLARVLLRAGDHVRHVDERFADDYALVEETDSGTHHGSAA